MTRVSGQLARERARHVARQRWFDMFKRLRAGETVDSFAFWTDGRRVVAREIVPYDETTEWREPRDGHCDLYVAFAGRGRDGRPGVFRLCWKGAGDPYVYDSTHEVSSPPSGPKAGRVTVPVRHVYGVVGRVEEWQQ